MMKVLLVTNFCAHFRVKTFEAIGRLGDVRFLFFSDGGETYWEKKNDLHGGDFNYRYLPGFYLTRKFRIAPSLLTETLQSQAKVIVATITGRFTVPLMYTLARITRRPFILWTGLWYHPAGFFHRLTWPLTKWLYRHSDAILVYGEHVKRYLVGHGVSPDKIFLFWQSVDVEKMGRPVNAAKVQEYRKRWSPDRKPIVLFVGRMDPVKSLDTLIQAYASLCQKQQSQLVIVGRGPEAERLKSLAKELQAPVLFEDYIANAELPEVYAAADVFCLPSESRPTVKEAWGLVLNEAMLQGCIPVASDAVGAAVGGLFFDELNQLVFPERNPQELERTLVRALGLVSNPELRSKIKSKARFFSPENQAHGLVEAYEYVLKARQS